LVSLADSVLLWLMRILVRLLSPDALLGAALKRGLHRPVEICTASDFARIGGAANSICC
jgi:hypothetical protein